MPCDPKLGILQPFIDVGLDDERQTKLSNYHDIKDAVCKASTCCRRMSMVRMVLLTMYVDVQTDRMTKLIVK